VHSVDQRPNLRYLCERLVGTEGLIKTVSFKKTTESMWYVVKNKISVESEFQTKGTATLKHWEANIVWTRGTNNTLMLEEHRERARMW